MKGIIFLQIVLLVLSCHWDTPAQAQKRKTGMWKVALYNRAAKKIKVDCLALMGKNDFKPHYECLDKETKKLTPFNPGTEWEPVSLSPVCMEKRTTGFVNNEAFTYESGKDGEPKYLAVNRETEEVSALGEQWTLLPLDDSRCERGPVKFPEGDDPPKNFKFSIISDLEESTEEEADE